MSTITLVLVAALSATPDSLADAKPPHPERPYHILLAEMRDVLLREAKPESSYDHAVAVHELSALFLEVVSDPRIHTSDTLKGYKTKMRSRLLKVKRNLELKIVRQRKAAKRGDAVEPDPTSHAASSSLYDQLAVVGSTLGGPASLFTHPGAAGGGAVSDNASDLIELIQRTINPEFWDVNGGPGTIVYYAPLHALVVRASSEVHGNVGGVIGGLRRAGN